jgi:membrane-associated phospholipid phosphatase
MYRLRCMDMDRFFLYLGIGMLVLLIIALIMDSTTLWKFITVLGEEYIYIAISIILYSFNPSLGFSTMLILIFSANISILLKNIFAIPRPPKEFWRTEAGGYSFPSGHTQTTSTFWYTIAFILKNRYLLFLASSITLAVGISRIALRVHWISDVVGGYLIGFIVAYTLIRFIERSYRYTLVSISITALLLNIVNLFIAIEVITYRILGTVIGLIIAIPIHIKTLRYVERFSLIERIVNVIATLFLVSVSIGLEKLIHEYGWTLYIAIPLITVSTPIAVPKIVKIITKNIASQ